jgi:hypothetical protein
MRRPDGPHTTDRALLQRLRNDSALVMLIHHVPVSKRSQQRPQSTDHQIVQSPSRHRHHSRQTNYSAACR